MPQTGAFLQLAIGRVKFQCACGFSWVGFRFGSGAECGACLFAPVLFDFGGLFQLQGFEGNKFELAPTIGAGHQLIDLCALGKADRGVADGARAVLLLGRFLGFGCLVGWDLVFKNTGGASNLGFRGPAWVISGFKTNC